MGLTKNGNKKLLLISFYGRLGFTTDKMENVIWCFFQIEKPLTIAVQR